jgi:hypothetical protein
MAETKLKDNTPPKSKVMINADKVMIFSLPVKWRFVFLKTNIIILPHLNPNINTTIITQIKQKLEK